MVTAINWLTSQPWPVFLAIWLPSLTVFGGVLLALFARPPRRERETSERKVIVTWHGHPCGCICTDKILPCDAHKGHAGAALHSRQEAP